MDTVSRLTASTESATAKVTLDEEEDLPWLRDVLYRRLGHPSEKIEEFLRTHERPTAVRLWNAVGEELRREGNGSLLEFYFSSYAPAAIAAV